MVMFTEELTSDGGGPFVSVFAANCATSGVAPAVDIERKSDGAPERPVEYKRRCQRSQGKVVFDSLEIDDGSDWSGGDIASN